MRVALWSAIPKIGMRYQATLLTDTIFTFRTHEIVFYFISIYSRMEASAT